MILLYSDLCNEPAFTLNREAPSWHNAYGFATIALLSASFGLQGAAAEPLGTGVSPSSYGSLDPTLIRA